MGKKLSSKSKKRGKGSHNKQPNTDVVIPSLSFHNFLATAGPGCHIARIDDTNNNDDSWVLEWERVHADDFGDDDVPDLAVDPEENTLTLCNIEAYHKVAFISVFDCVLRNRHGKVLTAGTTTTTTTLQESISSTTEDRSNKLKSCTTLIILCPPYTFCHLCYLPDAISPASLHLESDVQEWRQHPDPSDTHIQSIGFPLQASKQQLQFLCTQGVGGHLTHFLAGNLHAIDFQCSIGTPLLAVVTGTVISVKVNCNVTGIAMSNLFSWNSILLQLDEETIDCSIDECGTFHDTGLDDASNDNSDWIAKRASGGPLFVEYVHIASATVAVGEKVTEGQVIGASGSIGFSPEPHLHLACYRSDDDTAPTCRFLFHSQVGGMHQQSSEETADATREKRVLFLPKAGHFYNAGGLVVT